MRPTSENGEKRIELVKSNIVKKGMKREENKENKMPTHANQSHLLCRIPSFPHQLLHTPPAQLASLCSSLNPLRHAMEKTNNSRNYLREKKTRVACYICEPK